jgi:hypothetical protein
MQKNEGTIDRLIRAIVGIIVLYFAYSSLSGIIGVIGYIVGIALLVTAAIGYCHLYKILGINTKK